MPTTAQEVAQVKSIVDKYLPGKDSRNIFEELWNKVGSKSDNESVKLSFLMLKEICSSPDAANRLEEVFKLYKSPLNRKQRIQQCLLKVCLALLVMAHTLVIVAHGLAAVLLPIYAPWYVWLPIIGYIANLLVSSERCVLTILEDRIRRSLGMGEIKRFIGYYSRVIISNLRRA